jgi:hypothetical protein
MKFASRFPFTGTWLCLGLATGVSTIAAQTLVVDYNAGAGLRDVTDSAGVTLPNGNEVLIGYFNAGFDVAGNADNLSALSTAWVEFDSTTIKTIFGQPGRFADSQSSTDATFDGKKIYLWVFQTTGNSAPAPDNSNVTAYGLYSSTAANWTFPAHDNLPPNNATAITSGDVNQALFGVIAGDATTGHLQLAPVPEPATYALTTGVICLGWVAWRRGQKESRA